MVVDLSLNELAETNDIYCQRNRQLIQEYEKRKFIENRIDNFKEKGITDILTFGCN